MGSFRVKAGGLCHGSDFGLLDSRRSSHGGIFGRFFWCSLLVLATGKNSTGEWEAVSDWAVWQLLREKGRHWFLARKFYFRQRESKKDGGRGDSRESSLDPSKVSTVSPKSKMWQMVVYLNRDKPVGIPAKIEHNV